VKQSQFRFSLEIAPDSGGEEAAIGGQGPDGAGRLLLQELVHPPLLPLHPLSRSRAFQ